ncbi:hypothetical protein KFE98_05515 [bacterium SCSIO 12741]|nr:hypothetical protein KFE98_05515 [bacterium SCSIO 12741]
MIVSVFKTNISAYDLSRITPVLNDYKSVLRWSTDLEDCDNILRIESQEIVSQAIVKILGDLGLFCEELMD